MSVKAALLLWCVMVVVVIQGPVDGSSRRKRQSDQGCTMADIVFVLDSSGSITEPLWPKTLEFVNNVVGNFTVGPRATQFGSVTFGNIATVDFHLNEFSSKDALREKVNNIGYKDENTNTSGGLWVMKEEMFTPENGDRLAAPNIGIVITDGASTYDSQFTIPYALDAKAKGIVMIVIGVGPQVNRAELEGIATKDTNGSHHVYEVADYNSLNAIEFEIAKAACDIRADCSHVADVAFVIDASSNIQEANFNMAKQFMKSVLDDLNVADGESNIALITYADMGKLVFNLHEYHGRDEIKAAVDKAQYTKGSSNLADALKILREQVFIRILGDRTHRTNIAIVLTNRGSNSIGDAIREAKLARLNEINIVSIGIRSWLNEPELLEISSDPDSENAKFIPNYGALTSIVADVRGLLCDGGLFACYQNPCQNEGTCISIISYFYCVCPVGFGGELCQYSCQPADIVFTLDASGLPGPENFYRSAVNFTKNFVRTLNLDPSHTRVAFQTFSDSASVEFYLGTYRSRPEAVAAISPAYPARSRNTADAISTITNDIMTQAKGARINQRNVNKIGILLTYGRSTDTLKTRLESAKAHEADIKLLVVSVNTRSDETLQELRGIASDPNESNLISVNSFYELGLTSTMDKLTTAACNGMNECSSSPCQNGGSCTDTINGYTCRCPATFTGVNCQKNCNAVLDIVIAVDSSGSIRENRFPMVLKYVQNVVNDFDISLDRTRVGLLTFADTPEIRFHLNTFARKEDILQAIDILKYTRGRTNIADTINIVRTQMFTPINGDRPNANNILWIFTDGVPTLKTDQTVPESVQAKYAGIHIQSVTMTPFSPTLAMKNIVTFPWQDNLFTMRSYNDLTSNFPPQLLCDAVNECDTNPCNNGGLCVNAMGKYYCICNGIYSGPTCSLSCDRSVDLVFILDASGSTEDAFEVSQQLTRLIVQNMNFANGRTRVGIMTYSDQPTIMSLLNSQPMTRQTVLDSIAFSLVGGRTNTAAALDQTLAVMFQFTNGDRPGNRNVAVVVTDGMSNINQPQTIPAALRLKQAGVAVISVGLRDIEGLNMAEVRPLATNGTGTTNISYSFELTDPATQTNTIATTISNIICQDNFPNL